MPKKRGVQTACCICGYHVAIEELLMCEREPKNTVGNVLLQMIYRTLSGKLSWVCRDSPVWVSKKRLSCTK